MARETLSTMSHRLLRRVAARNRSISSCAAAPPSRWEPFTWPRLLHYTGSSCPTSAVPRVGVARAAVPVWRVMPIALRAMQVPLLRAAGLLLVA